MNSKILTAVMIVCTTLLCASAGNYYKAASNYNKAANNYIEAMENYREAKAYPATSDNPLTVLASEHDPCVWCFQDRLEVFNEGMALGWKNGVAMFRRSNMQYAISPDYDVLDNPILHNPPLKNVRAWAEYYRLIGCEEQGPPAPDDADRLERMGGAVSRSHRRLPLVHD